MGSRREIIGAQSGTNSETLVPNSSRECTKRLEFCVTYDLSRSRRTIRQSAKDVANEPGQANTWPVQDRPCEEQPEEGDGPSCQRCSSPKFCSRRRIARPSAECQSLSQKKSSRHIIISDKEREKTSRSVARGRERDAGERKRTLSADLPPVDIAPERARPERRGGQKHAPRPRKGVIDPFARARKGLVRHEEGRFRLHRGGADVGALLEVKDIDQVARRVADLRRVGAWGPRY